jgi:hypothetical protein
MVYHARKPKGKPVAFQCYRFIGFIPPDSTGKPALKVSLAAASIEDAKEQLEKAYHCPRSAIEVFSTGKVI